MGQGRATRVCLEKPPTYGRDGPADAHGLVPGETHDVVIWKRVYEKGRPTLAFI